LLNVLFRRKYIKEFRGERKKNKIEILYFSVAFKQKVNGKWAMAFLFPFLKTKRKIQEREADFLMRNANGSQHTLYNKRRSEAAMWNGENVVLFSSQVFRNFELEHGETSAKKEKSCFQRINFYSFDIFLIFAFIRFPILCFTLHTIK
jgi:hypothetical protein